MSERIDSTTGFNVTDPLALDAVADAGDDGASPAGGGGTTATPAPLPVSSAPPASDDSLGGINWSETIYEGGISLNNATVYPDGFVLEQKEATEANPAPPAPNMAWGWEYKSLSPLYNQRYKKEGADPTDGVIFGTSGGGMLGVPGSAFTLFAGLHLWNIEVTAGADASSDGNGTTQDIPKMLLGAALVKYKTINGVPDLDNDLYDLGVGFNGFNTFNAHLGGNVPAGPLYFRLDSKYTATRSDADYYFKDFDTVFNGGPLFPRAPEGMSATNKAEAHGSVLINVSDLKSAEVKSVAILARGDFGQSWDDDALTTDNTTVNGGLTLYHVMGTPLPTSKVKKYAPLAANFDLGWGNAAYLGEWYLPSTCADSANPTLATCPTTDEFLGVPYDPFTYRGEEDLEQMPHNDKSLVAKVSLGGTGRVFQHKLVSGAALVFRPELGFTYEIIGDSEQKLQPLFGASVSLEGAGKFKR